MITYHIMDATCPLASCLHSGPLPFAQCLENTTVPAYVETISAIPSGTVAQALRAISEKYGVCGVLALDDESIVGKIRTYPQAIIDQVTDPCVQQESTIRPLIALELASLPRQEDYPVLYLYCMQVAGAYYGRGIAGGMLDALISWAADNGWRELRAPAVIHIPPLLAWSGQFSRAALDRRGFTVTGCAVSADIREGVVSQRAGQHGEHVLHQWEAFAHVSDDEAAQLFTMTLDLERTRG